MTYDLENVLEDIRKIIDGKLNDQIAIVNAEKNDGMVLKVIPEKAIFLQQMNGDQANYDPLLLYGVDDIGTTPNGPYGSDKYQMSVIIIVQDSGQDVNIGKRMFRYLKALRATFQENWISNFGAQVTIESNVPVPLTNLNTNQTYRAVGVTLNVTIAP